VGVVSVSIAAERAPRRRGGRRVEGDTQTRTDLSVQGRFGTATSVEIPHWNPAVKPLECHTYHVPFAGRNTPRSRRPSPSKSPGTGTSESMPQCRTAPLLVAEYQMYHMPFDGRNTARSARR